MCAESAYVVNLNKVSTISIIVDVITVLENFFFVRLFYYGVYNYIMREISYNQSNYGTLT